jgi:hypothetical protein
MSDADKSGEERLREEIGQLAVDEILALCYSFAQKPARLRLYLDVLRSRGGQRAQFAACLICFDLARQGDGAMQRDFLMLAEAIRGLASDEGFVGTMIGEDPYLTFIWELLSAQLDEMDGRMDVEAVAPAVAAESVATLDLFSEADLNDDLGDLAFDIDEAAIREGFDRSVERFLGKVPEVPAYDPNAGFRLGHRGDTDRIERFLMELDSFSGPIPAARAFRVLALLFYGTHMRSKSLFGSVNERKQLLLREGLREFERYGERVWEIVGVMGPHAEPEAWSKIAEVLIDFMSWRLHRSPSVTVEEYDAVERQIARDRARGTRSAERAS